jgi:hypothetical protein
MSGGTFPTLEGPQRIALEAAVEEAALAGRQFREVRPFAETRGAFLIERTQQVFARGLRLGT